MYHEEKLKMIFFLEGAKWYPKVTYFMSKNPVAFTIISFNL